MVYTLHFFSSKCSLFHNSNVFGSCIIQILYTGCSKIKKINSGAERLIHTMIHPTANLECADNTCNPPRYVQRADMRDSSNS